MANQERQKKKSEKHCRSREIRKAPQDDKTIIFPKKKVEVMKRKLIFCSDQTTRNCSKQKYGQVPLVTEYGTGTVLWGIMVLWMRSSRV